MGLKFFIELKVLKGLCFLVLCQKSLNSSFLGVYIADEIRLSEINGYCLLSSVKDIFSRDSHGESYVGTNMRVELKRRTYIAYNEEQKTLLVLKTIRIMKHFKFISSISYFSEYNF